MPLGVAEDQPADVGEVGRRAWGGVVGTPEDRQRQVAGGPGDRALEVLDRRAQRQLVRVGRELGGPEHGDVLG